MKIERVGIAGFGELGRVIAHLVAEAGYTTAVWDIDEKSLNSGESVFKASIDKAFESGTLTKDKRDEILTKITFSTKLATLKDSDLVIESVSEDIELKKDTFSDLSDIAAEKALLATTTSCFSVTDISQAAKCPERVLGLHFFEPAQATRLVEVVRTERSSQETISLALDFCAKIGKETVVSKDAPGFIVNYLFVPYMNQALEAYDHGLASKEDLDMALRMGLGYPKGPLELINIIGPEKYLHLTSILYERLLDPKFAPPVILKRMVDAEGPRK
jgi:3-hydroxybutyryl-CoA dehydrogenase